MKFLRQLLVSSVVRQSGVVSSIIFCEFGHGMLHGIVSTMIATILSPDADFTITMETASWLGPIGGMGSIAMVPFSSYLMNKIGRKITYIMFNVPVVIGMVMNVCAYDLFTLLFGSFLCGAIGCTAMLAPMIIGEMTSPQYRESFLMLKTSFNNLGTLLVHFLGYYMHWRQVSIATAIPFIISIIISFTWPESPYWLAENNRFKESEEALYWLKGRSRESTREFNEIVNNQQNSRIKKTIPEGIRELFMKFKKKNFWKPVVIIALTSIMMECGGRHVFRSYASLIIREMTLNSDSTFYYNMALMSIATISTFTSAFLFKVFKLRLILFTTGFVAMVALYLSSLCLYLASNGTLSKEYSWLSMSLLGLFFTVVNLACTIVPVTISGAIFPAEHRAVGGAIYGYFLTIIIIIALKITPYLVENLNLYGTFTLFASGLLLCLVGLYIMLPETKDKTLQEIDDFFTYGANGAGDADDASRREERSIKNYVK